MSISIVSSILLRTTRERMSGILSPSQINLCSPEDKADAAIGIYLYDIAYDLNLRHGAYIPLEDNARQNPPLFLSLSFMFTSYIGTKSGILGDHKLLEQIIRIWHDKPVLEPYLSYQPNIIPLTKIELITPDMDEKSKIWQFSGVQPRLSVYYKVTPVSVTSSLESQIQRVDDVDMSIDAN